MIKILLTDDHRLVLDGLRLMLAECPDMLCVADAANGREALDVLARTPGDVMLLDINMPEMDGLECCRIAKENYPDLKILVLSMMREASLVKSMLKLGAAGYLLKNAGKDEVIEAIRKVYEGKQAFSDDILDAVMGSFSGKTTKTGANPYPKLSRREKQILKLIVEERITTEIADELFISFGTVETHRRNLLLKLKARNTAGLVKAALEYDLLKDV